MHKRGREITDYICGIASRGTIAAESERLAKALASMARMFSAHFALEDTVVFPAWRSQHSETRLQEIAHRFQIIGQERLGPNDFEQAVARISKTEQSFGLADIAAFTAASPSRI